MTVEITSVGIGTVAEDGTGDAARTAFGKLNTNDTNLKAAVEALQAAGTPDPVNLYGGSLLTGSVIWLSGLVFDVSALEYIIGGTNYTSAPDTVTLNAADGTHPRIDVIYADTDGLVGAIAGTPAADPAKPSVDPLTQLELTFVTVSASATTPDDVGATLVYGENAGSPAEWVATESTSTARITLADTSDPYAGTKAILYNAATGNDTVTLTYSAGVSVGTIDSLELHVKSVTWPSSRYLTVGYYLGASLVSALVQIKNNTFGFDTSNVTDYQTISISAADFLFTGPVADNIRIAVKGNGSAITCLVDQVRLQTGGGITIINITQGLTENQLIYSTRRWYAQQFFGNYTLTDGATVNWNLDIAPIATITLGGNRTLAFTNARAGGTYLLRVIQDGTGSRTMTWPAGILWPAATDPTLTTTAAGIDVFSFACFVDGTLHGAVGGQAFG